MLLRLLVGIGLAVGALPALAQTLDPTFQLPALYRPAPVRAAVAQPDGKRLVVGDFARSDAGLGKVLLRYNADNTLDQAFAANVSTLRGDISNVRVLPSGKLLLIGEGPLTLGSLMREDILRLNADGTADASFNAGLATSGGGTARISAVQADGRIVLGGSFSSYNGVAAPQLVRLLPDGAVDGSFSGAALAGYIEEVTLQPDGKILVGGAFASLGGIVRLLPTGSVDPAFTSPLVSGTNTRVSLIGVQPDGSIIVSTGNYELQLAGAPSTRASIFRLLPTGNVDPGFVLDRALSAVVSNRYDANEVVFQPDGRFLVSVGSVSAKPGVRLARFNPDGTYDPSFVWSSPPKPSTFVTSLQRQPNGQLLVAGEQFAQPGHRGDVLLLDANGAAVPGFNPLLLAVGQVYTMARQTDGKLLVGGLLDEVSGQPRSNLARLNPDGSLDAAFAPTLSNPERAYKTAVQPDGKVLVNLGEQLVRLLPSGAPDNTWQLPSTTVVYEFAVQPDGRIVLTDGYDIFRVLSSGLPDNSFTAAGVSYVLGLNLQADGKILASGRWRTYNGVASPSIVRLLANGQPDPSFTSPIPAGSSVTVDRLLIQPDGRIVAAGSAGATGALAQFALFRMQPSGALDNTFAATLPNNRYTADMLLQPNGRLLLTSSGNGVLRKLENGQPDASFGSLGLNGDAYSLLVQPDGKLLVGGAFSTVNGQPALSLVRLTAPNVLRAAPRLVQAPTDVWPNPAREVLHLRLDAAAHPRHLTLLDLTGKAVREQATGPATELTLPVRGLTPGTYLLRVQYATGPVTRRVVVE